ncbi:hypothetical protein VNO80_18125 [Phaseolus coccineus]|uniref:Uncharacterized protein n=1 Tax=Phaseolus coccineus TaxID=3886 RepID=A0AAN9QYL6_PHACN
MLGYTFLASLNQTSDEKIRKPNALTSVCGSQGFSNPLGHIDFNIRNALFGNNQRGGGRGDSNSYVNFGFYIEQCSD